MVGDVDSLQGLYLRGLGPPVVALLAGTLAVGVAGAILPQAGLLLAAGALGGLHPPGEVRRVAEEVLGDPGYATDAGILELDEGFVREAIRLLGKLVDWVLGLGTGLASLQFTQPLLFWTIVAGIVLLIPWKD